MNLPVPDPRCLAGLEGRSDDNWFSIGMPPKFREHGWKLYISATIVNYISVLHVVAAIFVDEKVPFKYLRDLKKVREINSGARGFSQIGKCIVAYMHDVNCLPVLKKRLKEELGRIHHDGPFVPRLPAVWHGAKVFYRYGCYRGDTIDVGDCIIKDDRSNPSAQHRVSEANPFLDYQCSVASHDAVKRSILEKYPVVGTLYKSGKGGVFRAIDVKGRWPYVIAKIGLKHGQMLPDGRDGASFVDREHCMYRILRNAGLQSILPNVLDYAREDDASILILEYIDGENLALWRRGGGSDSSWLYVALSIINRVHSAGYLLNDAKTANFMKSGRVLTLVDLESLSPSHPTGGGQKPFHL